MGVWWIVILSVMVGAVANEHPPANPPYLLEELQTTSESRVHGRVENLLQALNDKVKVLMDGMADTKRDICSLFRVQNDTEVYLMQPDPSNNIKFEVSRDWTNNHGIGGGWIVFQRRLSGLVNFTRNWTEYKNGFGYLHGEHWLGLDKLHAILKTRRHELLIVLEDIDGETVYAHYDDFKIGDENEKYVLKSLGNYIGAAGDALSYHKNSNFSTYDQDNDASSRSARSYKGGWWHRNADIRNLNGQFLIGEDKKRAGAFNWIYYKQGEATLKSSKMMVRPVA